MAVPSRTPVRLYREADAVGFVKALAVNAVSPAVILWNGQTWSFDSIGDDDVGCYVDVTANVYAATDQDEPTP